MQTEQARQIEDIRQQMERFVPDPACPDDRYALQVCQLALEAVSRGNFGIGAVLVDADGRVIGQGQNEVFQPHFRSDRHAEMVVMDAFEEQHPPPADIGTCTLYSSWEPCPMCLTRLITAGVGRVLYVADDDMGGMVRRMHLLPPVWLQLAQGRLFGRARCSQELADLSKRIVEVNLKELQGQLEND